MTPVEIKKDIYWVGVVDWSVRDFHGYVTRQGTTYNAYLIQDETTALFDTVRKPFRSDLVHNIRRIMDPARIDYIIANHCEMDHSGCLPEMVELIKPKKIFCSKMGHKNFLAHFHRPDWPFEVVENGQTISLGRRSVTFFETRMVHWPDSMFSYVPEEKLLISSDAFGQHWATSERFDDQVDPSYLMRQAAKYYANILLLYSPLIQKLLAQVARMGLALDMIAPDHGLIWRGDPGRIVQAYDEWSKQTAKQKAVVIYDTMWHSTEMMAKAVVSGLVEEGISVKLMDLKADHRSDVMTEVLDARAVVVGSPTLNNGILPTMADMLHYLRGLRPAGKIGAAFGSFGWSGECVKILEKLLEECGIKVALPGVKAQFVPDHEALGPCLEMGRRIGRMIKESAA